MAALKASLGKAGAAKGERAAATENDGAAASHAEHGHPRRGARRSAEAEAPAERAHHHAEPKRAKKR